MERKFYLLSIILNQQARLELLTLRRQLFRELGAASALAFEPAIPLAWCGELPDSALFARFSGRQNRRGAAGSGPTENSGPPVIETGRLKATDEALFLQTNLRPGKTPDQLKAALPHGSILTPARGGLFPVSEGIFLAANEFFGKTPQPAERLNAVLESTTLSFSTARIWRSARIGAYSIRTQSEPWWQHVEWTLEWKIQLKQI